MLIFDIGANIGKYTLSLLDKYKDEKELKIICVEASPFTYKTLMENLEKYKNLVLLNVAIADGNDKEISFYHAINCDPISTINLDWLTSPESRFYNYVAQAVEIKVTRNSIDDLIKTYGMPDILKIDVEGAEESVINSLSVKTPVISFEWASEWHESLNRAIDRLYKLGYTKFHVQIADAYDYYPDKFELTYIEAKNVLINSKRKTDWGMVWAM